MNEALASLRKEYESHRDIVQLRELLRAAPLSMATLRQCQTLVQRIYGDLDVKPKGGERMKKKAAKKKPATKKSPKPKLGY